MVTDGVACNVLTWCSEDEDLGFVVPDVPSAEDLEDSAVDLTVDVSTDGVLSKVLGCSEDLGFVVPEVPSVGDSVDTVVDLTVDVTAGENGIFSEREKCPAKQSL